MYTLLNSNFLHVRNYSFVCLKSFWFEQVVLSCLFIATIEVLLFKQLYSLSTSRKFILKLLARGQEHSSYIFK